MTSGGQFSGSVKRGRRHPYRAYRLTLRDVRGREVGSPMARNQPSGRVTVPGADATAPSAARGSPAERDQTDAESDDHEDRADDGPHGVAGHRGATYHTQPLQRPDGADHDQHHRDDQHDDLHQELLSTGTCDVATIASRQPSAEGHPPLRRCHAAARNAEYHVGRLTRYRRTGGG